MERTSRIAFTGTIMALISIFLFLACESPGENTPTDAVDAFLGRIQSLSEPIYARKTKVSAAEADKYNEAKREIPKLFADEKKGRVIMMTFLFGTFESYDILSEDIQGDVAEVKAEISGSRFLGIKTEQESAHSVRFRLVKQRRRWYIGDLMLTKQN